MANVNEKVSSKALLMVVAGLLAVDVLTRSGLPATRAAGVPDTGSQTQEVIDQLRDVNKRLDGLRELLESGNLTIKTKPASDKADR